MFLLLIQVLVLLLLLLILAVRTRSRTTKALQASAVFAYLLALHLAGFWLELPWWTPWGYWLLYIASLVVGRCPQRAGPRREWLAPIGPAFWGAATIATAAIAVTAVLARTAPAGPIVDLSPALPPGRYLVVNGGNSSLTNAHFETLRPATPRQAVHRGQSFGVDIVGLTPFGRTTVVERLDGRPDMPVPLADEHVMTGNHVILQCGEVQVLLAHLRQDSVTVRQGELVRTGQKLGEVGNSGNSGAPHLHIHAQRSGSAAARFDANPLPIRIDGRYLLRGDRL